MNEHYKVLILEDLPTDAELAKIEIRKVLKKPEFVVTDTREGFIDGINNFKPDIIVSDYQLPSFDGMSALKIALEMCPFIPFIILTGSMNEDTAVDCMKAGATDYVIKEHIKRLGTAIISGLEKMKTVREKKNAQDMLIASEEKYRRLVENTPDIIYKYKLTPFIAFEFISSACETITGYKPEEFYQDPFITDKLIHKSDKNSFTDINYARENFYKTLTFRWHTKRNEIVWLEQINIPIYNEKNELIAIEGIARDITKRKLIEESHRKLSKAVEQSPISIILTDIDGKIEYVNPSFTKITGYNPEDVIGHNPKILKSKNSDKNIFDNLWKTITHGDVWYGEFINVKKNGDIFYESSIISPIFDENGNLTHYLAVSEDITEQKRIAKEIELVRKQADDMNKLKNNFLANISHELRTPLNSILGYSNIISKIEDEDISEMAKMINTSGKRLHHTLNLLLELTRIESNNLEIKRSLNDINILIKEFKEIYYDLAKNKGLEFKTNLFNVPLMANLDINMFKVIISNVLDNALKYTEQGHIELSTSFEIFNNKQYAVIHINDTGIGIPENVKDIIFKEFRQASEGLNRKFEGTGLGLTVVKKFVELLDGAIDFQSQLNKGTIFSIRFPVHNFDVNFKKSYETQKHTSNNSKGNNQKVANKILLVDDDNTAYLLTQKYLKDIAKVDYAQEPELALEKINNMDYPMILLDINLKHNINGINVLRNIREIEKYRKTCVIAITAYAMPEDREYFLKSGFTDYLVKPFSEDDLKEVVNKYI